MPLVKASSLIKSALKRGKKRHDEKQWLKLPESQRERKAPTMIEKRVFEHLGYKNRI